MNPAKIGSSGRPTIGADVKIVKPSGDGQEELPVGETGEIVVSGSSIAIGYWRDPELTAQRFTAGWWRSGDLGHVDDQGYIWVDGRVDNVINTGGIKVHAEEIEEAIRAHPDIRECAVVGRTDATFGQRIVAYVSTADPRLTAAKLEAFLRDETELAGFKVPKSFFFVDALPTGATGKVDRKLLASR